MYKDVLVENTMLPAARLNAFMARSVFAENISSLEFKMTAGKVSLAQMRVTRNPWAATRVPQHHIQSSISDQNSYLNEPEDGILEGGSSGREYYNPAPVRVNPKPSGLIHFDQSFEARPRSGGERAQLDPEQLALQNAAKRSPSRQQR